MNESKMTIDIDQQIHYLRFDKILFWVKKEIFDEDFDYKKIDEKILTIEKLNKHLK